MNKSGSVEDIQKEIRETYLAQKRLDAARKVNATPFRRSDKEVRWDVDHLTVVWHSSDPKT